MAARYRKFYVQTWTDAKFLRLSSAPPNAQTLWFYLLTGPETANVPGLYRAGEAALAEALGWSLKAFRQVFREVEQEGMVRADWKARVVWVPNSIRYNPPESVNAVKAWAVPWREIPDCALKSAAMESFRDVLATIGKDKGRAFLYAFAEVLGEALPEVLGDETPDPKATQEQEQEQEQEKKNREVRRRWRRRPPEAVLTPERIVMATAEGLDASQAAREWAKYGDHEYATGKVDVDGTWRNWCRKALEMARTPNGTRPLRLEPKPQRTADEIIAAQNEAYRRANEGT